MKLSYPFYFPPSVSTHKNVSLLSSTTNSLEAAAGYYDSTANQTVSQSRWSFSEQDRTCQKFDKAAGHKAPDLRGETAIEIGFSLPEISRSTCYLFIAGHDSLRLEAAMSFIGSCIE